MGELKEKLTDIKEYIKTARIYYKVDGSDKMHVVTPLTYSFLKGKIFDLERISYNVKDNISYIHFYKILNLADKDYIEYITAGSNTKVEITVENRKYNFKVNANDVCIKDDEKYNIQVKGSKGVRYSTDVSLVVYYGSKTSIDGNIDIPKIEVLYSPLEMNNIDKNIDYLFHIGDKINFNNVHCKIKKFFTNAKSIDVRNSSIESCGETLTDEYDRQVAALEEEIINDSQNNIVKTLVKKK